jgi:thiamine kinase-like enzyme
MNQAEKLLTTLPSVVIEDLKQLGITISLTSDVRKLSHGLSNQNYLIFDGENRWVLRSNSSASNGLCDRQAEVKNWRVAAQANLAPELYYVSSDHAYFVSEYIEEQASRQWAELLCTETDHQPVGDSLTWPSANKQLLRLLSGLAKLTVPDNIISVASQWHIYLGQLRDIHAGSLHDKEQSLTEQWLVHFHQLLSLEEEISQWLEKLKACALDCQYSHRDLNPHNVLYKNNQLFCIDFEYACGSHPLFDLAGVLSTHKLSTKQSDTLIHAYLLDHPKLTSDAISALPAAINIYWVFAACWSLLMASGHSSATDENIEDAEMSPNPHKDQEYLNFFAQFFSFIN